MSKKKETYLSLRINYLYALIFSLVLCLSGEIRAQDIIPSPSQKVYLENDFLQVCFDLESGKYSLTEKATGTVILAESTLHMGDWDMSNTSRVFSRSAKLIAVKDRLGTGKTLQITARVSENRRTWASYGDSLDLELSLTLYDKLPALILGGGIHNHLEKAVLVKGFSPLYKAKLWPGDTERSNPLTLDGHSAYGDAVERTNGSGLGGHVDFGRGQNSVLPGMSRSSENNLLLTYRSGDSRRNFIAGGLTYYDFLKRVKVDSNSVDGVIATAEAYDPVGRLVDAGSFYRSPDRFYIGMLSEDPFSALEQYALSAAKAQEAAPNLYNFPTLCLWYIMVTGGDGRNNTVSAVEQMKHAKQSGFLKYSPVAIRLVPDKYHGDSEQGWWDDEHWQKYGHYVKPYETSEKFCNAIRGLGGLPFSYVQTGMPSDDFSKAYPNWMLNNSIKYLSLAHDHEKPYVRFDYSDPGFQNYLQKTWGRLGKAGLSGVMFDYPETGFAGEGGLEDPYCTATAAYRKIFELAREGLGPEAHIHERNLGEVSTTSSLPNERITFSDMTLGLADCQRVEIDASLFTANQVSRCALRWYKSRVFYVFDMDSKSLLFRNTHGRVAKKISDPAVRRQSILTMLYVTGCRVLLADSFKDFSPEILKELSRLYPLHKERKTARPVDLFLPSSKACPKVYLFSVNPRWHQVTFFNPDMDRKATISSPLSGDATFNGALSLEPDEKYYVYDFWNKRLVGILQGSDRLEQNLRPGEARMMSIHQLEPNPQFISTNRHIMQGYVDMAKYPEWDKTKNTLSGTSSVVVGETYSIIIAKNGYGAPKSVSTTKNASIQWEAMGNDLIKLNIDVATTDNVAWLVKF